MPLDLFFTGQHTQHLRPAHMKQARRRLTRPAKWLHPPVQAVLPLLQAQPVLLALLPE